MKTDKKQLPQLIVLGVLVVACIGFVSFQFMGAKPIENASKTDSAGQTQESSAPSRAPATVTEDVIANGVFPELATVPSRRDPFVEQPLPGQKASEMVTAANTMPKPRSVASPSFGPLPRIGVAPLNPFGSSQVGATETPQETKFSLTGVVRGDQNVAILRTSDGGRYVVRQNESVNGRYKVLMVTDDAVVLSDGGRRIYVKLGGEQNAS